MIVYAVAGNAAANTIYTASAMTSLDNASNVLVGDTAWADWLSTNPTPPQPDPTTGQVKGESIAGNTYTVLYGCVPGEATTCVTRIEAASGLGYPALYDSVLQRAKADGWRWTGPGCENPPTAPAATVEEADATLCQAVNPDGSAAFSLYLYGDIPTMDVYVKGSVAQSFLPLPA